MSLRAHGKTLRACAVFALTLSLFSVAYYRDPTTRWLLDMTKVLALSSSAVLNAVGFSTGVVFRPAGGNRLPGYVLQGARASMDIAVDCNGAWALAIFLAAVLAVPSRWGAKAWGLGLGLPALWIANVLRVVSLYYIAIHFPQAFEAAHLYVWQFLIIGIAFLLLAIWVEWFIFPADGSPSSQDA